MGCSCEAFSLHYFSAQLWSWAFPISSHNFYAHSHSLWAGHVNTLQHSEQTMKKKKPTELQHLNHSTTASTASTCCCLQLKGFHCKQSAAALEPRHCGNKQQQQSKIWSFELTAWSICSQASKCGRCVGGSRRPCCIWCVSTLSGIKEGGGRLGWGKGQEEERRSKRAGGEREGGNRKRSWAKRKSQ